MNFFETLVGVETDLWNAVEHALLQADEVGLGTLMALRVLHRHGDDGRVQDLREDLSITVGAASKLVDRLERDGLAVRRPHPGDRRSSLIALTAAGDRARVAGERHAREVLAGLLEGVDVAALAPVLEQLRARAGIAREAVAV